MAYIIVLCTRSLYLVCMHGINNVLEAGVGMRFIYGQ